MKQLEVHDVTKKAVAARDADRPRCDAFVKDCIDSFFGFKIPVVGSKRRLEALEAELAIKNSTGPLAPT